MDNWQDNIDPRLLEQNVAQVGGFVSDEVPTENSQAPAHLAENSYNQHSAMNIDLDPEHVMMDLDADLPEVFYPSTPTAEASLYVNPATPVRPPSFQNHAAWNTPPSSLRADADVFYPAPSWETNNPFAPLAESHQLATLYQTPHANTTRVLLTPDTMSTGRGSHVRRGTMLSPVGRGSHYPFTVDTRNGSARERPPMSMNMNGVPANTPAAENIASWAEEAYSVPAVHLDASHLGPHTTSRPVQRSRAASVASTTGQGTFVCVGAPGKPCGKRFLTKSAMTHHARCHKPPRHFCSICDSGWYYMKDLGRHMKTHTPRDRHLICNNIGCKYHTTPFAREDHRRRHERSCRHSQQ